MTEEALDNLQDAISYRFGQVKLLVTALTHSSYANEQGCVHNERLEFLGDAVLELAVSEELFRRFPEAPEGALTKLRSKLVSMPALAELARSLHLDQAILLGKGEEGQGGRTRDSLLADAMEALLGAVFQDGGYEGAKSAVGAIFAPLWPEDVEQSRARDYKSRLQERTQRDMRTRPIYRLMGSSGPEHEKRFEVELALPDGRVIQAAGPSVKKAEQSAARMALQALGEPS
ncbi:Ribonuclease 3 [Fundidesulfovibrio magnetotacticus]|uniref:Ribonuclease 3 n=1 Tax=Fundidesulfovibrio magnetotacticus TaxID=2730080 RepID=A0A6V8LK08_9BACT|nr:ribonuclease III [Fundidesulfovibrio magnetotacticus]GFK93062.1 Ribonuclease 3 [Fundidesulfovibrio magnetotacticus]